MRQMSPRRLAGGGGYVNEINGPREERTRVSGLINKAAHLVGPAGSPLIVRHTLLALLVAPAPTAVALVVIIAVLCLLLAGSLELFALPLLDRPAGSAWDQL